MVMASDLAEAGYKYLGVPYSQMDCQAFVERCLADLGLHENLPGSNAWYRRMSWVGSPEACKAAYGFIPPGAFLFILEHNGKEPEKYRKDGIGNASHIGIYTAMKKGAIHSSASRGCVAESEFHGKTIPNGGWNRIGLWDRIDYGDQINRILHGSGEEDAPVEMEDVLVKTGGGPLNLRKSPGGALIDRIPDGDLVDVLGYGSEWCRVAWNGLTGYVATQYLVIPGSADGDMIQVSRQELQEIYDKIGGLLGLRG